MRSLRSYLLLAFAVMAACAFAVSSASALTIEDSSGTALANGSAVNGVATGAKLTGTILGSTTTVTCNIDVVGTVGSNGTANPTGTIDSISFTSCTNQNGSACTVTGTNLPWGPSTNAGLYVTSTTAVDLGLGSSGLIDISGASCLPGGASCSYTGSQTLGGVTNAVAGSWSNTTSQLSLNAVAVRSTNCSFSNNTWTAAFTLRTGSTVGSGSTIAIT